MALQDLTPQLRTRLGRMERAVGWFVMLALALLVFGFGYYIYTAAETKGWFKIKAPYYTYTDRATGLKIGDPVQLMGFAVGRITEITAMPAYQYTYNVYIEFELKEPFYDYIWTKGSEAKVTTADLLGKRVLEVTRGTGGYPAYVFFPLRTNLTTGELKAMPDLSRWVLAQECYDLSGSNLIARALTSVTNLAEFEAAGYTNLSVFDTQVKRSTITAVWSEHEDCYRVFHREDRKGVKKNLYGLDVNESAAVTERLEKLVDAVEIALPNILALTNQLTAVLSNSVNVTSNLNFIAVTARPVVSNLAAASARLDQPGLGDWLLPTNLNHQLELTLGNLNTALTNADSTFTNANTNLVLLAQELSRSLDNLANLTSNLNQQVQVNSNIVGHVSDTIVHADEFIQGLKRHWLLRSAFKNKSTNAPPASTPKSARSPKVQK